MVPHGVFTSCHSYYIFTKCSSCKNIHNLTECQETQTGEIVSIIKDNALLSTADIEMKMDELV